jgi:hypothetical protein
MREIPVDPQKNWVASDPNTDAHSCSVSHCEHSIASAAGNNSLFRAHGTGCGAAAQRMQHGIDAEMTFRGLNGMTALYKLTPIYCGLSATHEPGAQHKRLCSLRNKH